MARGVVASALNRFPLSAEQRTWPGLPLVGPGRDPLLTSVRLSILGILPLSKNHAFAQKRPSQIRCEPARVFIDSKNSARVCTLAIALGKII